MNNRQVHRSAMYWRLTAIVSVMVVLATVSGRLQADTQTTGLCPFSITIPFTDVPNTNIFFCSIAASYFSGLTNGTSANTYSPSEPVPRDQMAAFVSRTLDQSLRRGSRRAALKQWWTPAIINNFGLSVGSRPSLVESDGTDLWVANEGSDTVARIQSSTGRLLQQWNGATNAYGVVVARGFVYVTGVANPGLLWRLDPLVASPGANAVLEAGDLGAVPQGIAYDGAKVWTANIGGSVSVRSFGSSASTYTVSTGFVAPIGILFDGSNIWVTDLGDDTIKRLNFNVGITATIPVGSDPGHPVFDGMNIWVPNQFSNSVSVVRVKDSAGNPLASPFVLAILTSNGLDDPRAAAFDGQRILVTNHNGNSVSLWKATDLTPLGSVVMGTDGHNNHPLGACSDGINFWIALSDGAALVRF